MKNILVFIMYFIFFSNYLKDQTTAIPDPVFEQKLVAIRVDSDGLVNGQILNYGWGRFCNSTFCRDYLCR